MAGIIKDIYIKAGSCLSIALLHLSIWFLNTIGYRNTLRLSEKAGDMLYFVFRRTRAKVLHNLAFAYGDGLSAGERKRIARSALRNLLKNWFEVFFYAGPNKSIVDNTITITGLENLDRALSRGKGVIAVSAHMGDYPIMTQQFTRRGYTCSIVIRDPKNPFASATYTEGRRMIGLTSIFTKPERQFYKNALGVVRNNGILCLISDENKRHGGIFVDFFGHTASTAPGPAALALRTGAPLVPMFMIRNADDSQTIVIEKEMERQETGDQQQDMLQLTEQFTGRIEDRIRKDPAQWVWTNWRWRTQPGGQLKEAKIKKKRPIKKIKKLFR